MGLPSGAQQEQNTKLDPTESDRLVSVLASPELAIPIVVGGSGGAWGAVIPTWSNGSRAKIVTRPIKTD